MRTPARLSHRADKTVTLGDTARICSAVVRSLASSAWGEVPTALVRTEAVARSAYTETSHSRLLTFARSRSAGLQALELPASTRQPARKHREVKAAG